MTKPLTTLITGASQGIGAATATAFVKAGHKVILAARNQVKLETLAAELGPNARAIIADISDQSSVNQLYQQITDIYDRLDVVFNNAGINIASNDIADTPFDEWRKLMSVNLDGAFLIAQGAFRMMKEQTPQGGRIINNGSISAHAPRYNSAPYTSSKHAITGLTKSIALDGRPYSIACSQIDIGNAASDMTVSISKGVPQADGALKAEPIMPIEHVADAVLRMAELPLNTNILFQTIMATNMPLIGRG